jgi:predicted PurR-regulated permease PerM
MPSESPIDRADPHGSAVPEWLQQAASVSWRLLLVGAALYFVGQVIGLLSIVIVPFVMALFIAALLEPLARWFERVMPASLAALLALLLGTSVLVGALVTLGFSVAQRLPEMTASLRQSGNELIRWVETLPYAPNKDELIDSLQAFGSSLQSEMGVVAQRAAAGAQSLFAVISGVLLAMAFGFFLIRDGSKLFGHVAGRLEDTREAQLRAAGTRAWLTLGRYLRGLALIALANAVMTAIALLVIGVPMVLPIAVLMFIGSFIPFAGPIIAGAVAALVALTQAGLTQALLVIAAAFAIQAIEGNVLQPFIIGRTLRLHPITVLGCVTIGAVLGGLGGAFVAIPFMAAIRNGFHAAHNPAALREARDESDRASREEATSAAGAS